MLYLGIPAVLGGLGEVRAVGGGEVGPRGRQRGRQGVDDAGQEIGLLAQDGGLLVAVASVREEGEVGYAEGEGYAAGLQRRGRRREGLVRLLVSWRRGCTRCT